VYTCACSRIARVMLRACHWLKRDNLGYNSGSGDDVNLLLKDSWRARG